MAYFPIQNQLPASYGASIMNYANMFIAAGWTIPWSLDGTTFTPNATPAVNPLTAATWTNNNYTGFGVLTPDGVELSFQRGASGGNQLRVGISAGAMFRDALLQFSGSATSGNKFTVADGDGVTKTFALIAGAGGDVIVACAPAANAAAQVTAFLAVANTAGLGGTFYAHPSLTDCVVFKKNVRTTFPTIANTVNSPLTSFNPSGTRVPLAYDDGKYHAFATGTDISPTFTNWLGTNGAYRQNGTCSSASPYHFAIYTHTNGANTPTTGIALDRRTDMEAGSFSDVALLLAATSAACLATGISAETNVVQGWVGGPTVADAGWGNISAVDYESYYPAASGRVVIIPNKLPIDPWTSQDVPVLIPFVRRPASLAGNPGPFGPCGQSSLFWWVGQTRVIGDLTAGKTRWTYGDLSIIGWDGATALTQ